MIIDQFDFLSYQSKAKRTATMEIILKNPGLQHLVENIFLNLNRNDIDKCKLINESSFHILENPMFRFKMFIQKFSTKNQDDWTELFKYTKNGGPGPQRSKKFQKMILERKILFYLEKCLKNEQVVDVPCYINLKKQSDLIEKALKSLYDNENVLINIHHSLNKDIGRWNDSTINEYLKFLQLWAILTIDMDYSNEALFDIDSKFKILKNHSSIKMEKFHYAFNQLLKEIFLKKDNYFMILAIKIATGLQYGFSNANLVKILIPLTADDPNSAIERGIRPISQAIKFSEPGIVQMVQDEIVQSEIVQILAPLTKNPNAIDENNGETPIHTAAYMGFTKIVQILAPLAKDPNAADTTYGLTPIHGAAYNGHIDIVKILAPLTKNPNCPDKFGKTPIDWARIHGDLEIVAFLESYGINSAKRVKFGEEKAAKKSNKRSNPSFSYDQLKRFSLRKH